MIEKISFIVYGVPKAKGRPRMTKNGFTYTPAKTREAEECFYLQALKHKPIKPINGTISINVAFYMPIPKATSKKKRQTMINEDVPHVKKPDLDNLIKMFDALNDVFWENDAQIWSITAVKVYNETPFIIFILNTGLRLEEFKSLRWQDFDEKNKRIHVKGLKGSPDHNVPLSNTAFEIIMKQPRLREVIFLQPSGRPYTHHFYRNVKNVYKKIGLSGTVHKLRHTFFSHLIHSGKSLRVAQEIGGWSSIKMMEIYLHLSPSHVKDALSDLLY